MIVKTKVPASAARSQLCPRKGAFFLFAIYFFTMLDSALAASPAPTHQKLPESREVLFTRITANDGISHTASKRIIQDSKGFIWIGTQQGLNRYDGSDFEIFNYSPDKPGSLSNGWIFDVFEDREGRIWVATDGGLDLFQANTKSFRHFRHNPDNPASLPHDSVRAISQTADGSIWVGTRGGLSRWNGGDEFTHYITFEIDENNDSRPGVRDMAEDAHGHLWIGTQSEGLIQLDPATGDIQRFEYRQGESNSIGHHYVRTLLIDRDGLVWVGTQTGGIALVDHEGNVRHLRSDPEDPTSLSSDRIWSIFQDRQGRIWVGTEEGLNRWLPEEQAFYHYRHEPANPHSLSDDMVFDISQDQGNVLWVGTFGGISKWNTEISSFSHLSRDEQQAGTLSNNKVSSFAEADNGDIWVGTIGGGVNRWNIEENSFQSFKAAPFDDESLAGNLIISLLQDDENRLWAGTMRSGVSLMDIETGEIQNFRYDRFDSNSLSSNAVSSLFQDSKGRIWLGTYGGALNLYLGDGRFQRYPRAKTTELDFPSYFLVDIEEAPDGRLWLASDGGGVIRFDPDTESVESMQFVPNGANSINGDHVICLLQTKAGLWVGTRDTGLNFYADNVWSHFNYEDGLPRAIYGLLEDDRGRIWISHSKGLSSYDPAAGKFTNYSTIHGLQGNDFNNGAFLKTRDGKLLFGGSNGFNAFYPDDIHVNTHKPPIRLTRFTKFNREVPLEKPAYELENIELNYDDYVIGFEFAALDFTDPIKNQYRYMLAGFDREWVSANGVRQATYTNLGPGRYTFRVEGSNNDGIWSNQDLSIDLHVSPAPWATWWAMALYTMVAIIVVYGSAQAYSVRLHREEQQRYSEQLEALVAERTRALESEITGHKAAQLKLSRSLQEKEVLLKEVHHRVKNNMQVISSLLNIQADSVMDSRFVNLLTESQQRIKSMALIHENLYRSDNLLEINFHDYIEALANGLLRFYRFDNLAIRLDLEVVDIFLDIDTAVPCGLIINELVSNSLKHAFREREGEGLIKVRFNIAEDELHYQFSVSDNGNGIPEGIELENTGSMGLEIVRILTEQLDGKWKCNSGSEGTEFVIEFPRKKL
jgi:two-component sensor histidine kinase/ligand-binding sensor domain-containing protein